MALSKRFTMFLTLFALMTVFVSAAPMAASNSLGARGLEARQAKGAKAARPAAKAAKAAKAAPAKAAAKAAKAVAKAAPAKAAAKAGKAAPPAKAVAKAAKAAPPAKAAGKAVAPPAKAAKAAAPAAKARFCPLPGAKGGAKAAAKAGKVGKVAGKAARRSSDHLRRQDGETFIGWHGTSQLATANKYKASPNQIPVLNAAEVNGRDAELGAGLYAADDIVTAAVFAGANGFICSVFVNSAEATFARTVPKAFVPLPNPALNNAGKVQEQSAKISALGLNVLQTMVFSPLGPNANQGNQALIPISQFTKFRVSDCLKFDQRQGTPESLAAALGRPTFPALDYTKQTTVWNIARAGECA